MNHIPKMPMTLSGRKPRVAWVALQPAPYIMPLFQYLRDSGELDIHFFFSDVKGQQPWEIGEYADLVAPESYGWTARLENASLNTGVIRALMTGSWDAMVIAGYVYPTMGAAILTCLARRIPFILEGDTTLIRHRAWWKRALKRTLLFPLLRRCSAAIGLGMLNQRYWHYVGIPEDRTFIVPFTSHLDRFVAEIATLRTQRSKVRQELGIPEDRVVGIFVGRLINHKALDKLLRGLALVAPTQRPEILIVGDGPLRASLENIVKEESIPVRFMGFRQNQDLLALYTAGDFFVLPSRNEAWGIVVAEAAASGLPLLLSDQVGAAYDLLEDGRNGFLVAGGTPEAWCDAIQRFGDAQTDRKAMGERSREISADWTCERAGQAALRAIEVAVANQGRRHSKPSL